MKTVLELKVGAQKRRIDSPLTDTVNQGDSLVLGIRWHCGLTRSEGGSRVVELTPIDVVDEDDAEAILENAVRASDSIAHRPASDGGRTETGTATTSDQQPVTDPEDSDPDPDEDPQDSDPDRDENLADAASL